MKERIKCILGAFKELQVCKSFRWERGRVEEGRRGCVSDRDLSRDDQSSVVHGRETKPNHPTIERFALSEN